MQLKSSALANALCRDGTKWSHDQNYPFRFLILMIASWMNCQQQDVIGYLQEDNCILREQLCSRRLRFTDD